MTERTRKRECLDEMNRVVPWAGLVALGSPFAPVGKKGRPPFAVATMLMLRAGTVVDATLIAAPSSTKNASGTRDPEMHQTRKGNQWYFGMKAHIGTDAESGLAHMLRGTAANVHDVVEANALLHGDEADAFEDAGYEGAHKRADTQPGIWPCARANARHWTRAAPSAR